MLYLFAFYYVYYIHIFILLFFFSFNIQMFILKHYVLIAGWEKNEKSWALCRFDLILFHLIACYLKINVCVCDYLRE